MNTSFKYLRKQPFDALEQCQPVYCDQQIFFINEKGSRVWKYDINGNQYQRVPLWMTKQKHLWPKYCIAADIVNKDLHICNAQHGIRTFNLQRRTWTNHNVQLNNEVDGCSYIQSNDCIYMTSSNFLSQCDNTHYIYDCKNDELQTYRYSFDAPNQLIYCRSLDLLIGITNDYVSYLNCKDIKHKTQRWKKYDYQLYGNYKSVGVLYGKYYLLLFDKQHDIHCLDLRSGLGCKRMHLEGLWMDDVPETMKRKSKILYNLYLENVLFGVINDNDEIHLFSKSKHIRIKIPENANIRDVYLQVIDGYLHRLENMHKLTFASELRQLIIRYYPNCVL